MFYDYENTPIYYETAGTGTPILMLHGLGGDSTLMKACMEPLFGSHPGYERIYLDLPGMGRSKASDELASSDQILNMLTAFIRDTIRGNFLLAGESYGGYLANGILSGCADSILGILLLCPVVTADFEKRTLPDFDFELNDEAYLNQLEGNDKKNFGEYAVIRNAYTHKRYTQEILSGLEKADKEFVHILKKYHYPFGPETADAVSRIYFSKPALILCGKQDRCVGYQDAFALLEHYPRASFAILDTAGHNLQIEQPKLFETLADGWIRRVETGIRHQNRGL